MKKVLIIILFIMQTFMIYASDTLERTAVFGKKGAGPSGIRSVADIEEWNGMVFLLDPGNSRVVAYKQSAGPVLYFGKFGSGKGEFDSPKKLAVDPAGCIYVLDYYDVDHDAKKQDQAGQYYHPRIQKFGPDGRFLFSFGRAGAGESEFLCSPADMVADKTGRLIVLDSCDSKIKVFSPEGKFLLSYGSYGDCASCMDRAYSLDVDADNNVLVLDTGNSRLLKFDPAGRPMPMPDLMGNEDGELLNQNYFKVLENGEIAVLQGLATIPGNTWSGTQGKYSITVRIKYFDVNGKFLRYSQALAMNSFDKPPYEWSLASRDFKAIGAGGSVYLLDPRNVTVEKYILKDVFVDGARITKRVYAETLTAGRWDRYYPSSLDAGYYYTYERGFTGILGFGANYVIDDRSGLSLDAAGFYGKSGNGADSAGQPVPAVELYNRDTYGSRIRLAYNRTYDLNENKNFDANIAFEYTGDMTNIDPATVVWHNYAHAIHSTLSAGMNMDLIPNVSFSCSGHYYFWADYYDDENFEHPDWRASARLTLGF